MEGFHFVKRYSELVFPINHAQHGNESKHKAYIFLQAIVILNTENFINIAMGYRNTEVRYLR